MATFAEQVEFLNVPQFDPTTNLRYQNGYVKVLGAGTSTKATVYSARDKGGTFTNPFALDSDDTKEIYLDTGAYDFELYEGDPDDVDNPGVKRDTISGMTYGLSDNSVDDLFDGGYDKTLKVADVITKTGPVFDIRAYGATAGSESSTEIQAAIDAAYALAVSLDQTIVFDTEATAANWNRKTSVPPVVIPAGIWTVDTEIIVKEGVTLSFLGGAVLKAATNGMTVLKVPQEGADYGSSYAQRWIRIENPIIDGDDKASIGLHTGTISSCTVVNPRVFNCTYKQWTDGTVTGTITTGSASLTVSSSANLSVHDNLYIHDGTNEDFLTIRSISGTTVTCFAGADYDFTNADVDHLPTGWVCSGNVNKVDDMNIQGCYLGLAQVPNKDDVAFDDMLFIKGRITDNVFGLLSLGAATRWVSPTIMHNVSGRDYIIKEGQRITFEDAYMENEGAWDASVSSRPIVFIGRAVNAIDFTGNLAGFPEWRRVVFNRARWANVKIRMLFNNTIENPTNAGDYALVAQDSTRGTLDLTVEGAQNYTTNPTIAVVDESGNSLDSTPNAKVARIRIINWATGDIFTYESDRRITGERFAFSAPSDGQPRLSVDPNTGDMTFGDGTSAVDTTLKRAAAGVIFVTSIGVGNSAAATTPGSVTRKIEVFNASGTSLGFLPVYDAIT